MTWIFILYPLVGIICVMIYLFRETKCPTIGELCSTTIIGIFCGPLLILCMPIIWLTEREFWNKKICLRKEH